MVNYNCLRCGYSTNIKTIMLRHYNRQKVCKAVLEDIDIKTLKYNLVNNIEDTISVNPGESSVNFGKSSVNPGKSLANLNESYLSDISDESPEILKNNKSELICKYCNKTFLRKDYLENHLKKSCKMLKEFNNIYEFNKDTFGKNIYKNFKNAGDIYIIQTDYINNDHFKIGITNNIQKRLSSYRCGNTYEPRLHYYISCQDINKIDNVIKTKLVKHNIKREIFKGDVENLKKIIVDVVKKEFNLDKVYIHEPNIKLGDLSECSHCEKCFYNKKDLFEHLNICEEYKEHLSKKNEGSYKCKYCEKKFSSYKSLWRHLKTCKIKKEDDEEKQNLLNIVDMLNEQLKDHKKQIDEQNKQINELIKKAGMTIGTQNIQQNIKILAYKNTDLSHLTDQDYLQCLNRSNMVIPNLIKKIHFNPKKPENHNIYISNIKNKYIMVYDGDKWNLTNQNDTIEDLIDTNEVVIEQKLEEWLENGKEYPNIMKKFNRYLEKKEKDAVINKVKEEIKLILYNNRRASNEQT